MADGRITEVDVGGSIDGRIEPEYIVNASGAWAERGAAMAGVAVEMRPTRGVMVSVAHDRLGPVLNRCRRPDDGDIIVPHDSEVVLSVITPVAVDNYRGLQKRYHGRFLENGIQYESDRRLTGTPL